MRVVPRNNEAKLNYFATHLAKWLENASQIGITPQQVEELQVKVQAATAAMKTQRMAQSTARSATLAFNMALDEVASLGSSIMQQIRAAAKVKGQRVYPLASVRLPRKPRKTLRPGKPFNLSVELQATGALTLRWECTNPRGSTGTVYHLSRQIADGPYTFLGISGSKEFVDEKVPAGTSRITYRIQAIRTRAHGPAAEFPVLLGGIMQRIGGPVRVAAKGRPIMIAA